VREGCHFKSTGNLSQFLSVSLSVSLSLYLSSLSVSLCLSLSLSVSLCLSLPLTFPHFLILSHPVFLCLSLCLSLSVSVSFCISLFLWVTLSYFLAWFFTFVQCISYYLIQMNVLRWIKQRIKQLFIEKMNFFPPGVLQMR
jgi:hypothetical protein